MPMAAVGRKSSFRRGLSATRVALAAAVTALIVMIVVYAIIVVSRPEKLDLSVAGGTIQVERSQLGGRPENATIGLSFTLQANNPSGRARFYYTDILGALHMDNGTLYYARFPLTDGDMDVAPVSMLQTDLRVTVKNYSLFPKEPSPHYYFNMLYRGNSSRIVSNVMLQLNGTLNVGLYSVHNRTSPQTVYYCWPLTMAAIGNVSADAAPDDIPCDTNDPTK